MGDEEGYRFGHGKCLEAELGDDTQRAAGSTKGPEEIGVLSGGAGDDRRVSEDQGRGVEPVEGETVGVRGDAVATVEGVAAYSDAMRC